MRFPASVLFGMSLGLAPFSSAIAAPSFNCESKELGSIELLVCEDHELGELDSKLAAVFGQATKLSSTMKPSTLVPEQRGWVKGRNDCWKSDNRRACAVGAYQRRIAELQAKFRLVTPSSTTTYQCSSNGADELTLTTFPTVPHTVSLERGDQTFLLFREASAEREVYVGRNERLEMVGGKAVATLEYEGPQLNCSPRSNTASTMDSR